MFMNPVIHFLVGIFFLVVVNPMMPEACGTAPSLSARHPQTAPSPQTPSSPPDSSPAPDDLVRQALAAFDRLEKGASAAADVAEINRLYKMLSETAADNPWLLYIRGRSAVLSGRTMDGIRDLQRFSETPPGRTDWKTFRILGDVHLKDFPRLAEAHYRQALALADREPSIYLGLSQAVFKLGKRPEGLDLARRAVDLDGGMSVLYLDNLASLLRSDGKGDQAIAVVNRAIQVLQKQLEVSPDDILTLRRLGAEYEVALSLITERLRANAEDASGYIALAVVADNLSEMRRRLLLVDAIDVIEKEAIPRFKDNVPAELRVAYAKLLESAGRVDAARAQLEAVLTVQPDHAAAREKLNALSAPR